MKSQRNVLIALIVTLAAVWGVAIAIPTPVQNVLRKLQSAGEGQSGVHTVNLDSGFTVSVANGVATVSHTGGAPSSTYLALAGGTMTGAIDAALGLNLQSTGRGKLVVGGVVGEVTCYNEDDSAGCDFVPAIANTGTIGTDDLPFASAVIGWVRQNTTSHTSDNYALHANWGTGASVAVGVGSDDDAFRVTVTAGTTPGANPTIVVTFALGPFTAPPQCSCKIRTCSDATEQTNHVSESATSSQLTITYFDTPDDGDSCLIFCSCHGN